MRYLFPFLVIIAGALASLGFKDNWGTQCAPVSDLTIASASDVVAGTGGLSDITGTNFTNPVASITLGSSNPVFTLTTQSGASSVAFQAQVPANIAAGTYDLQVSNQGCNAKVVRQLLTVTSSGTVSSCLGTKVVANYRADSISSTPVGTWTDKSSNHYNIVGIGGQQPTWNSTSAHFNGQPSVTFDGVANVMQNNNIAFGTNSIYVIVAYRLLSDVGATNLITLDANGGTSLNQASGRPQCAFNGQLADDALGYDAINKNIASYCSVIGTGSSTETIGYRHNNIFLGNNSGTTTQPGGAVQNLYVGAAGLGSGFMNVEVAEIILVNTSLSDAETLCVQSYLQGRYGLEANITYDFGKAYSCVQAGASGVSTRISGTGFNATTTVTIAGVANPTTIDKSSTLLDVTNIPVLGLGTSYNVTIANANSNQSTTFVNAITGQAATTNPICVAGIKTVGWYNGTNRTMGTGSNVSGLLDLSGLNNNLSQGTAGNQPVVITADPNYNSQDSLNSISTSKTLSGNLVLDQGQGAGTIQLVCEWKVAGGAPNVNDMLGYNGGPSRIRSNQNGGPVGFTFSYSAGGINNGLSVSTGVHKGYGYVQSTGTNQETVAVNSDFGTEFSASQTQPSPFTNLNTLNWFDTTAGFGYTGSMVECVVTDTVLTTTEKANIATYLHNRDGT